MNDNEQVNFQFFLGRAYLRLQEASQRCSMFIYHNIGALENRESRLSEAFQISRQCRCLVDEAKLPLNGRCMQGDAGL
jgi:hypothetical protein